MMSRNPPHKWLLQVQDDAQHIFDTLLPGYKRSIFRRLQELLVANDPYSLPFVEMIKGEQNERTRKFRVGNYRIFFAVEPIEVTHLNYTYKGTLFVLYIWDRKDAYRP